MQQVHLIADAHVAPLASAARALNAYGIPLIRLQELYTAAAKLLGVGSGPEAKAIATSKLSTATHDIASATCVTTGAFIQLNRRKSQESNAPLLMTTGRKFTMEMENLSNPGIASTASWT